MFDVELLVTNIFIGMFFICGIVLPFAVLIISKVKNDTKQPEKHQSENDQNKADYEVPKLKPLTAEQIAEIHARGKITPAEAIAEWDDLDLCAPGDGMGGAAWRCRKFKCCHDCLVDFANQQDEYTSIYRRMREVHSTNQDTNLRI